MRSLLPDRHFGSLKSADSHGFVDCRKLLAEASVSTSMSLCGQSRETHSDGIALLFNDSILIVKCQFQQTSLRTPNKTSPGGFSRGITTFEFLVHIPFTFIAMSSPETTSMIIPTQNLYSSSSGVPSGSSTEGEVIHCSKNSLNQDLENGALGISLWWPISNQCQLNFSNPKSLGTWKASIQILTVRMQCDLVNEKLRVKVQNEITSDNASELSKCAHKYLVVGLEMTAAQLKAKSLAAWNSHSHFRDVEIVATFTDSVNGPVKIRLFDEARPFLLVLYVLTLMEEACSAPAATLHGTTFNQVGHFLVPKKRIFPIVPDQIPIGFVIRDISASAPTTSLGLQIPESTEFVLIDRPRSTFYPDVPHSQVPSTFHRVSNHRENKEERRGKGIILTRSRLRFHSSKSSLANAHAWQEASPRRGQFRVFGRLPSEAWPDCTVSMSLLSLFVVVFYKGGLVEGIFRKPVQSSQLQSALNRVDANEDVLTADEYTSLCCADTLKKYFSEIPAHLLIDDKWDEWSKITTLKSDKEIANYAKKMLLELPDINQKLLTILLFTLAQIRTNQETNKMSVSALSTVWGPSLLDRPSAPPCVADSKMSAQITACLLGQFTDHFCLKSKEFRRRLSCYFDEIWGQMNPPGQPKPAPEGLSILELPRDAINEGDSLGSNSGNSRLTGFAQTEAVPTKRFLGTIERLSRNCRSQESADIPPPIPPRNRRKSISPFPSSLHASGDSDFVPVLPPRSEFVSDHPSIPHHRKKSLVTSRDSVSVLSTTVVDRRRSLSRRRVSSRSLERPHTIALMNPVEQKSFMFEDMYPSYFVSWSTPFPTETPKSTPVCAEPSNFTIQRSTSDVDEQLQNKILISRKTLIPTGDLESPRFLDYEMIGFTSGTISPWHAKLGFRKGSESNRCERSWSYGLYQVDKNAAEGDAHDVFGHSTPKLRQSHSNIWLGIDSKEKIRQQPISIDVNERPDLVMPVEPVYTADSPREIFHRRSPSSYKQKDACGCVSFKTPKL